MQVFVLLHRACGDVKTGISAIYSTEERARSELLKLLKADVAYWIVSVTLDKTDPLGHV